MTESKKLPVLDVVCAVLLDEGGNVLVARRPLEKSLGRLWEFPGGKVEDGEGLSDALVREIREELGTEVVVEPGGLESLGTFDHAMTDTIIRLHPIVCRLADGASPPEALEHMELQWIPLNEKTEIEWAPGDRRIFAELREWVGLRAMSDTADKTSFWSKCSVSRKIFWPSLLGYTLFLAGVTYGRLYLVIAGAILAIPAWPLTLLVVLFSSGHSYPPFTIWEALFEQTLAVAIIGIYAYTYPRLLRTIFG